MRSLPFLLGVILISPFIHAQDIIPLDTNLWSINAQNYSFEHYKGEDAVLIEQGIAELKDSTFLNGTIEFDMYLRKEQSFPGVRFRITDDNNMESFYVRSHLPGKPDANQVAPVINGITAWQLYFGPSYSFPYEYSYDRWTHVKLVINNDKGQIYFNHSKKPHFSWNLVLVPEEGRIGIGGSAAPAYYANFKMDKSESEIVDFNVAPREPLERVIPSWQISDKFNEELLDDTQNLQALINSRKWGNKIAVEEGTAANISREVVRYDENEGNTVFTRITIHSDRDQIKLFEFGYSDRAVVILNGDPIYKGNNRWRSRDYRYLGTIGLFDAAYLHLKKGENTLLLAVSEDFGGWLVTGRFADEEGISFNAGI